MIPYCFIANYHLTDLFIVLGRTLREHGVPVSWIVVNEKLRQKIRSAGWRDEDILFLDWRDRQATPPDETLPPIKYNDLVAADRALLHSPQEGVAFLQAAAPRIHSFLRDRSIAYVFGEPTWAHERLTAHICRLTGMATYLSPHTIRLPARRWGFFLGENQSELYAPRSGSPMAQTDAEPIKVVAPAYLARNNERLRKAYGFAGRLDKLRRFLTRQNIHPEDPTHIHSRRATFRVRAAGELNREFYRFVQRQPFDSRLRTQPYVLYALHKQPESSIDVLGRYYDNQEQLIRAIQRTLPPGWLLLVKEHTNAIGDRSFGFFKRLQRLPGLVVVDEKASSHDIIEHAQAVFSVSGTVAYEAALKGTPALTFAPMFFNRFPTCRRITIDDLRDCDDMRTLFPNPDPVAQAEASREMLERSHEGHYTDPVSDPSVLEPENLALLTKGFLALQE